MMRTLFLLLAFLFCMRADAQLEPLEPAKFGKLLQAKRFGIKKYRKLKRNLRGTCLEAHHLIEQRFAHVVGKNPREMLSVALTDDEHQVFTNAWRKAIPYGPRTRKATRLEIKHAACEIYAPHPAFLVALRIDCSDPTVPYVE